MVGPLSDARRLAAAALGGPAGFQPFSQIERHCRRFLPDAGDLPEAARSQVTTAIPVRVPFQRAHALHPTRAYPLQKSLMSIGLIAGVVVALAQDWIAGVAVWSLFALV